MELAHHLRERRERLSLTQERVSHALRVPREIISYWENGTRTPSLKQLRELALLYNTTPEALLGQEAISEEQERLVLFRGLPENDQVRLQVQKWLSFLDEWADFIGEDLGMAYRGPGRPPRPLDEKETITDARRASALADKVRDYYQFGRDALPDLYAFLDDQGVLVYKANLGGLGAGDGSISGAYYNHARLGHCVLVNADTSPGRQAFTLAHEFAHALYHHAEGGIICRFSVQDPRERFANAFAGNLLVPGKEVRRLVKEELNRSGKDALSPIDALALANFFRVSYGMILYRLIAEGLISQAEYEAWKAFSPSVMAEQLGLDTDEFRIPEPKHLSLDRYPVSVLDQVKRAIQEGLLSPAQAAGLLDVDRLALQRTLLGPEPEASDLERREHDEFIFV